MSIESGMPSNHLILCCPLLLLPSIFPNIRVFSNESAFCIRWPKYWNFSFNISPSNELPGLISFKMDWLDLLAAQGTLKSLLQHHLQKHQFLCNKLHSNLPSITDYTVAPLHSPHHGMPRSTLLIHSLMSSFLLSEGTFFEFSHLFTLSTDSLIDSVNKHIQYSGPGLIDSVNKQIQYSGPGLLSLQGRAMPRSQFTPVAETSTRETQHHTRRVGEFRFIMPAGSEELTLQALSPKQRDYRVFIDRR